MLADKFILPKATVYMCGHSLGPMPIAAESKINSALQDWKQHAVAAWNKSDWINLPRLLGSKIARLIGANANEVVVSDSTVINLFKVLMSAIKLQKGRKIILTTKDNFPADLYIAQGIVDFQTEISLKIVDAAEIMQHIDENVAAVMLTQVNYRDAAAFDMQEICTQAKKFGVLTIWDLSHSIGIVPLDVKKSAPDFAVGCTYKYLSGGPGSPSFIYVNEHLHKHIYSPIYGWMGHNKPFDFAMQYSSSASNSYICGTPTVLSMKGLEAALEIFHADLIKELHATALLYGNMLITALVNLGLEVITPSKRGGHIAFMHKQGYGISRELIAQGIVCDYREPNLIRLCVNPLYLGKEDIDFCIRKITKIMHAGSYHKAEYNVKLMVT